jgi:hypothetical protein
MDYDLGFFDRELNKVEPVGKNPFAPKVLPMLSAARAGNKLSPIHRE